MSDRGNGMSEKSIDLATLDADTQSNIRDLAERIEGINAEIERLKKDAEGYRAALGEVMVEHGYDNLIDEDFTYSYNWGSTSKFDKRKVVDLMIGEGIDPERAGEIVQECTTVKENNKPTISVRKRKKSTSKG